MTEEEGISIPDDATLAHCKQLLHNHFAAVAPRQTQHTDQMTGLQGRTFAHTFVTAAGEWTDTQYRWARGLAPRTSDECSQVLMEALPPEVRWGGSEQRWCFYNVHLPYPNLSWIGTMQVAGGELDQAVRGAVDEALDRLLLGTPVEC